MSGFLDDDLMPREAVSPDSYPRLGTMPGFFNYMPVFKKLPPTEYVRVPLRVFEGHPEGRAELIQSTFCIQWNLAWEAGPLREHLFEHELPEGLRWIHRFPDNNFCFVPAEGPERFAEFSPLYNMLPARLLQRMGLPLMRSGLWPGLEAWPLGRIGRRKLAALPSDWVQRLGAALAQHLWPLLYPRPSSPIVAFSSSDSLCLLAHNVDFWLPYLDQVLQEMMKEGFERCEVDAKKAAHIAEARRMAAADADIYSIEQPLKGGVIWCGEEEAWSATERMVEAADAGGRLRAILDALESHRLEDDFSDVWSPAKEDLERKLYSKRSKLRVTFVELKDTIPIYAPEVQVEENLFWEDFLAVLQPKERRVLVLLRSGHTQEEIARALGYANHSPVSKALKRIAQRAQQILK